MPFLGRLEPRAGGGAFQAGGRGREERLDLVADALEIAVAEQVFHAVEEAVPDEGQADRLPGAVVGPGQGVRQRLAVVGETFFDGHEDGAGVGDACPA